MPTRSVEKLEVSQSVRSPQLLVGGLCSGYLRIGERLSDQLIKGRQPKHTPRPPDPRRSFSPAPSAQPSPAHRTAPQPYHASPAKLNPRTPLVRLCFLPAPRRTTAPANPEAGRISRAVRSMMLSDHMIIAFAGPQFAIDVAPLGRAQSIVNQINSCSCFCHAVEA